MPKLCMSFEVDSALAKDTEVMEKGVRSMVEWVIPGGSTWIIKIEKDIDFMRDSMVRAWLEVPEEHVETVQTLMEASEAFEETGRPEQISDSSPEETLDNT